MQLDMLGIAIIIYLFGLIVVVTVAFRIYAQIRRNDSHRDFWTASIASVLLALYSPYVLAEFHNISQFVGPLDPRVTLRLSPILFAIFILSYVIPSNTTKGVKLLSLFVWLWINWPYFVYFLAVMRLSVLPW